jgi:histidinol-phosphate aminotransferase
MTISISRRAWLQRSAMAAAILPISGWYRPDGPESHYDFRGTTAPLRLNSNENAYGPGEAAKQAILDSLGEANRYPWSMINQLKEAIGLREGLSAKHVLITAGSTEVLGLAGLVYGLHQGELLACSPTFDFLLLYAERLGYTWARTPLDENFQYDLNALSKLTGKNTKLIFVCNPNNPTGIEIPFDTLKSFVESEVKNYPVYIDEAYIELSPNGRKNSIASLVDQNPNLVVSRTFSKVHGLAGMRIGYALAHPDTIDKMEDYHLGRGMSVSVPGAAAALASLNDAEFESMSKAKIVEGRKVVSDAFDQWGVNYLPSATNFVFFKNDKFSMEPQKAMEQENILIRTYPGVKGWTRVSIGKVEEMQSFVRAAQKYVM